MPPKGKKKGDTKIIKAPPSLEALNEQSKEYYLVEIHELETRATRYQQRYDELKAKNSNYEAEFERILQDQKEAVTVYNKTLEQRIHELADMKDRLVGLQQAKEVERDWYEKQLQQLGTEYKETKDQLISENTSIGIQLAQLDDFKIRKSEYMAKLASLEKQVTAQKESHQDSLDKLENKDLMARDRMKEQMLTRLHQVADAFRKVSLQEMADTTKRTIQENVLVASQLGKMSERSADISQQNVNLRDHFITGHQQIKQMETRETELARNYVSSRKIIEMLMQRIEQEKKALMECELEEEVFKQLQVEADVLREQLKTMREGIINTNTKEDKLKLELARTQKDLEEENKAVDSLTRVIIEAAAKLRAAFMSSAEESSDAIKMNHSHLNANILEELHSLLANREISDSSTPSKQSRRKMKLKQTSNSHCVISSKNILPPINVTGSMLSLQKEMFDVSKDNEVHTTKDVSTQIGSKTRMHGVPSRPEHLIGKLTLSECEQVLLSRCQEF